MGFLRLLFVPGAVLCMLKLNSNQFWHPSSVHIISLALLSYYSFLSYAYGFIYSEAVCMHGVLGSSA